MDYNKSMEIIEKVLFELIEENNKIPVIVEGEKDITALRSFGLKGEIISLNKGVSLTDFCDSIARTYCEVIILTDWDRRGGYLAHTIERYLFGRVRCNTYFRELIAKNSICKTIEGLPSWYEKLKEKVID